MDMNEVDLKKIGVDDLADRMELGDVTVLDVRVHPTGQQIRGAIRIDPNDVDACDVPGVDVPKDRTLVTYCT